MKLREYYIALKELIESDSELLDLEVYTAIDEEGNSFNKVHFLPDTIDVEDTEDIEGRAIVLN